MPTIEEFIAAEAAKPFAWAETDCASTADRWVQTKLGRSPMERYRFAPKGEYDCRVAMAMYRDNGLAIHINRAMRASGFKKTAAPRKCDVGLVWHVDRLCVAIHAGRFWFSRDETGLIGAPLDACWKAWRIA